MSSKYTLEVKRTALLNQLKEIDERLAEHRTKDAVDHLRGLVSGLRKTHWSSWQTTAHFDTALQEAEEFLEGAK